MKSNKKVIYSFLPIGLATIIIVYFACVLKSDEKLPNGISLNQELFVSVLIFVNSVLVGLNTILFLKELIHASKDTDSDHLSERNKSLDKHYTNLFIFFNVLTLIFSIVIIVLYVLKYMGVSTVDWGNLFEYSELGAVFMFLFFVVADCAILAQFKLSHESNTAKLKNTRRVDEKTNIKKRLVEINSSIKFTKKAIWLIDITGFIGIFLIVVTSHLLKPSQDYIFVEGFAVGAIAFHILFTQMNFAVLNYFVHVEEI
jgi:hypothetical protein